MIKFSYYVALIISMVTIQVSRTAAQQFGVKGKVLDIETYKPIPGVSIKIANTTLATSTDEAGEFSINLPSKTGEYTLVSTFVGYDPDSTKFNLQANDWEFVSVTLINTNSTLDEVVVTRRRERASEIALLEERKLSNLMVEKIGAQELSRKGVGDAAGAVSQLSGVSRQEGSTQVYVRGLGDRYITTSLNGMPIPASDPNLKNIALDIFPTDVIEYIGVDKVNNATLSGDFGGANVDISSKNFSGSRLLEISVGSNVNTNALKQAGDFYLQEGPSYMGYSKQDIPDDAEGSYHFRNSWDLAKKNMAPLNFGLKYGNTFHIGTESQLNVFATGSFSNNYGSRSGVNSTVSAQGAPLKVLDQSQSSYKTNATGMFNANYLINNNNKISYNFLYANSSDQFVDHFSGFLRDAAEDYNGYVRRSTFLQTQLIINQILGDHRVNDKVDVSWGAAYNVVDGDMPDRMQSMLRTNDQGEFRFIRVNAPDNHRYTYMLKENELAARLMGSYKIGDDNKGKISVGYNGRFKKRTFDVMQLNFDIDSYQRDNTIIDISNLDEYLGASGFGDFYQLRGFAGNAFQYYNGDQDIHAGFVSLDYLLSPKLALVAGVRFENIKQLVDYYSIEYPRGSNTIKKNAFLPSLNLKYILNDNQNLRLGASKTYTLPQFKERARFPYEDVTEVIFGNPYLYASDNYNFDIKWEMFPSSSELLSIAAFGKYIENPINQIMVASATNDISYANTGENGYAYGIELELRKDIFVLNEGDDRFSIGFNSALMKTHQDFDAEKVRTETKGVLNIDPTHSSSKFTGASDIIVNTDLSYLKKFDANRSLSATVLYNYYSDKLYAIGTGGLGNRVDRGIGTLDAVIKSRINRKLGIDLSARNILNPSFKRDQVNLDPVTILSYKRGVFFNLSVKYHL